MKREVANLRKLEQPTMIRSWKTTTPSNAQLTLLSRRCRFRRSLDFFHDKSKFGLRGCVGSYPGAHSHMRGKRAKKISRFTLAHRAITPLRFENAGRKEQLFSSLLFSLLPRTLRAILDRMSKNTRVLKQYEYQTSRINYHPIFSSSFNESYVRYSIGC